MTQKTTISFEIDFDCFQCFCDFCFLLFCFVNRCAITRKMQGLRTKMTYKINDCLHQFFSAYSEEMFMMSGTFKNILRF